VNKEVSGSREFLDEILLNARREADELISQAEEQANARREGALFQEASLRKSTESQLERERHRGEKQADQKIAGEIRRKELLLRDRFMKEALGLAREKLIALTETEKYEPFLADWVLEGALGLDVAEAEVNGRKRERGIMTGPWLRKQEERLEADFGRKIKLTLSDDPPLLSAGVQIRQKKGRLMYNNQIETRLLRKQSDIRKLIYQELFEE
jgi:vacuolar-type H+-ATPase subunit E/Vma4